MSGAVPIDAHRATDIAVLHAGREVVARIGEICAALDALLRELGAGSGVFVTRWNPRIRPQPSAANAAANGRMAALFTERGVRALNHVGRAREGD